MAGSSEDPLSIVGFYDNTIVHHRHPIGNAAHDSKIVGDEQHRHLELPLKLFHQIEDLGLDRNVQGRSRFIREQQLRLVDQGHGDHHPLALASGERVGEGEHLLFRVVQSHPLQPIQADRTGLGSG